MTAHHHLHPGRHPPLGRDNKVAVGAFGESLAARYLAHRGARILGRNIRRGRGEIDVLVQLGDQRIAVEVKTRVVRSPSDEEPLDGFDEVKAARVRATAALLDPPVYRIDVVAVSLRPEGVELRWLPSAA